MKKLNTLAYDFGASSGRGIIGEYDGERLSLREIHRFSNDPVNLAGAFCWDFPGLFNQVKQGLLKTDCEISSIGIDTWGVDYGLLDNAGRLISNPYHYRDLRTDGYPEGAYSTMAKEDIFSRTGLAFLNFNTLYQLLASKKDTPYLLDNASTLLMMPDLFAYFLTGAVSTEYTIASTSQLINIATRSWDMDLIRSFGLPEHIFTSINEPGEFRGRLLPSLASELSVGEIPVISVAGHDTASAIASVPAKKGENFAYISSGTWSLMGTESTTPCLDPTVLANNLTNEGGVFSTYRILKNIMGLWIIQECRRKWNSEGNNFSFADLVDLAEKEKPLVSFINPDAKEFMSPGNMPDKVKEFCRRTGQPVPETIGAVTRCVYESLAMEYRHVLNSLEALPNAPKYDALHIVGGGSQNLFLNRATACAINRKVVCGPVEATAIGNIAMQLAGLGELNGINDIRELVSRSFPTTEYLPTEAERWDEAYEKYLSIRF
ncbi:MAG: rhamnulokinase [Clostridiales bacterium]|nr:rhamnulokinase [Clostridiales bacterium]